MTFKQKLNDIAGDHMNERDRQDITDAVNNLAKVLNHAVSRRVAATFVGVLVQEHRALQQEVIDMLFEAMAAYGEMPDTLVDDRNLFARNECRARLPHDDVPETAKQYYFVPQELRKL